MDSTGNELNSVEGQSGRSQRSLVGGEVEGRRSRLRISGSQREEDIQVVDLEDRPEELRGGGGLNTQQSQDRLGGGMEKVLEDMLKKITTDLEQRYESRLAEKDEKEKEQLNRRVQQLERQLEVSTAEKISLRREVQRVNDKLEQVSIAMEQLGQFPMDFAKRISTVTTILSVGAVGGEGGTQEEFVSSSQSEVMMEDSSMGEPQSPVIASSELTIDEDFGRLQMPTRPTPLVNNAIGAKLTSFPAEPSKATQAVQQTNHNDGGYTVSPPSSSRSTSNGLKIKLVKLSQQQDLRQTKYSQVVIRKYKKVRDSAGEAQKVFSQDSQMYGLLCDRSRAEPDATTKPGKQTAGRSSPLKKRLRLSTSTGSAPSVKNPLRGYPGYKKISVLHGVDADRMTKEPGFFCICSERAFASKYTLESHISRYQLQGRFNCQYCSKSFRDNHNLKKHTRNVHNGL